MALCVQYLCLVSHQRDGENFIAREGEQTLWTIWVIMHVFSAFVLGCLAIWYSSQGDTIHTWLSIVICWGFALYLRQLNK